MRQYERLAEQDRLSRRTIMDALEVLRQIADFQADDHAEIHIGLLKLPSAAVVGLVDMAFVAPRQEQDLPCVPAKFISIWRRTPRSPATRSNSTLLD